MVPFSDDGANNELVDLLKAQCFSRIIAIMSKLIRALNMSDNQGIGDEQIAQPCK